MEVRVWGYLKEYAENKEEILKAVEEVFESGQLILGDKVRLFEKSYAAYCGVNYGIGVDNGTNAIILALHSLGIGEGDEVITVANTAIPTVSAIVTAGAIPVFVDIDPETYLMDISKIEAAITSKTRCILPVHLYGQCVDMDPLIEIACRYHLYIIEDCAQAQGALYKGKMAGCLSNVSTTSFYPTKVLGAYGDGGMILTNDEEINKKLRRLRFYGAERTYYALEHGYNSRLDEVQAAILLTKLPRMEGYVNRRNEIAQLYDEMLQGTGLVLPRKLDYNRHSYYLYVVRHPSRDIIISKLKERQIFLNVSYPWPIHTMKAYSCLGYKDGDLPETELAAKEIFSLPMYPTLTNEEIIYVCEQMQEIMRNLK
ncbi:DegT/DnrJ/EryC1/StrS family aminotransferase [Bacteroides ovatus]|uniref:DegT/DnrJ/EryC1/StrS family aminotransferase n=1 Tax=Bacteroides ovatus TaxID=28116 RepID=UPI0020A72B25|nr:DegT/DnrJ/EryC1/StrS family aminotransferase [Bacteroides ovatus]CAG9865744.1 Aminotransferase, DegT/DnrJ/EryC1/StrS family [Bacteroides ovatus]